MPGPESKRKEIVSPPPFAKLSDPEAMEGFLEKDKVVDSGDSFLDSFLGSSAETGLDDGSFNDMEDKFRQIDTESGLATEKKLEARINVIDTTLHNRENVVLFWALRKALKHDLVERLLVETGQNEAEAKLNAELIHTSYCRIMGILLKMEKSKSIMAFVTENLNDRCLPLQGDPGGGFSKDPGSIEVIEVIQIPGWTKSTHQNFVLWQGSFLTPFLAKPTGWVPHYILKLPKRYLPIVDQAHIASNDPKDIVPREDVGGQGRVCAIKLHPLSCHFHNFPYQDKLGWLAHKERMPSTSRKEFLREVHTWKVFNLKHNVMDGGLRICPLLCTLETIEDSRNTLYHLLLPLAKGCLTKLWSSHPGGGEQSGFTPQWMAGELHKLAETLSIVHNDVNEAKPDEGNPDFGRFGDVKPGNILWFYDYINSDPGSGGSLLFADLGFAKIHRRITKSRSFPETTGHSGTYRAPEFTPSLKQRIGRRADVWSFGCTLIEHLTWYILGNEPQASSCLLFELLKEHYPKIEPEDEPFKNKTPLEIFAELREERDAEHPEFSQDRFYSPDPKDSSKMCVRPHVSIWIKVLHSHKNCSLFLRELLSFIEKRMLEVDPAVRATAHEVAERMSQFVEDLRAPPAGS